MEKATVQIRTEFIKLQDLLKFAGAVETGGDAKLIAVPHDKLSVIYKDVQEYTDLPALLLEQIKHFFENYKDLEKGKWVKVEGWGNADAARAEITKAVAAFQK